MGLVVSEEKLAAELRKRFDGYLENAAKTVLGGVASSYRVDVDLDVAGVRIKGSVELKRREPGDV